MSHVTRLSIPCSLLQKTSGNNWLHLLSPILILSSYSTAIVQVTSDVHIAKSHTSFSAFILFYPQQRWHSPSLTLSTLSWLPGKRPLSVYGLSHWSLILRPLFGSSYWSLRYGVSQTSVLRSLFFLSTFTILVIPSSLWFQVPFIC